MRGLRLLRPNFWQVYRVLNFLLIVVALLLQFVYSARQEEAFTTFQCNFTTSTTTTTSTTNLDREEIDSTTLEKFEVEPKL